MNRTTENTKASNGLYRSSHQHRLTAPTITVRVDAEPPAPTVTRERVTPAMASEWWERRNERNRTVNETHVRKLAADMAAGAWRLTHEGIAFDPEGGLLDGHHRLKAIMRSGATVEMHIWRNIPRSALMAIDSGRVRSLGAKLTMTGGYGVVTPAHTAVLGMIVGGFSGSATLTAEQAARALDQYGEALAFAIQALPRHDRVSDANTRAVIARAFYSCDPDRLKAFANMLISGVVPNEDAIAVMLLRNFLYDNAGFSRKVRHERYAKTQRALVAFLNRDRITKLFAAPSEQFPIPDPTF